VTGGVEGVEYRILGFMIEAYRYEVAEIEATKGKGIVCYE
jgi:hypothetical protein